MRIFLDANVLFSAAKSDGAIRALVERLLEARHECWVDAYVIEEARRNILAKQPSRIADMEALVARLQVAAVLSDPNSIEVPEAFPTKDRPVLAAAIMLGCQALVTGDRSHFGPFYGHSVLTVMIHSPRSLFEHLFGPPPTDSASASMRVGE